MGYFSSVLEVLVQRVNSSSLFSFSRSPETEELNALMKEESRTKRSSNSLSACPLRLFCFIFCLSMMSAPQETARKDIMATADR